MYNNYCKKTGLLTKPDTMSISEKAKDGNQTKRKLILPQWTDEFFWALFLPYSDENETVKHEKCVCFHALMFAMKKKHN
jgi:hypothetical protein